MTVLKIQGFWNNSPCRYVNGYRSFGKYYVSIIRVVHAHSRRFELSFMELHRPMQIS